jgi:hypothetical protein
LPYTSDTSNHHANRDVYKRRAIRTEERSI